MVTCFHCGLPVTSRPLTLFIDSEDRSFCCHGCLAAAETIIASGLGDYYRFHQPNQLPVDTQLDNAQRETLRVYDRDDVQADFVQELDNNSRQCVLIIEGISCSACSWLIEKRLLQLPGIDKAIVNAGTHRLSLSWQADRIQLSEIFFAVFLLGYRAAPYLPSEEEKVRQRTQRQYILRLGVAGIGMMQAMMNSVALYSGTIEIQHERWLWWTSLILTLPVMLISAKPFFTAAWHALKGRQLSMDVSVSLAILSAFGASVYATFTGHGEVYFESVNMFTFFLVLSRFLEFRARTQATSQGNAMAGLLPQTCTLERDGLTQTTSIRDLVDGDIIQLLPGETSPVDGKVIAGASEFDESSITGEFGGVPKTTGSEIFAGTINLSQKVSVLVGKTGLGNTYNLLQQLIEQASAEKPRLAELADKGARQFIWSTLIISVLIGIAWLFIEPDRAFWIVISVLVVTCPCALSLATPTALAQAALNLKNKGLIITRGYVLERLAAIDNIAFDKTGTLTEGRFALSNITRAGHPQTEKLSDRQLLAICYQLEQHSAHNIKHAFAEFADTDCPTSFDEISNCASAGVQGTSPEGTWRLGSASFTGQIADKTLTTTQLFLSLEGELVASIELSDPIRSTVAPTLQQLSELGIQSHILTGDGNLAVKDKFVALGLQGEYQAGLKPDEKVTWVESHPGVKLAVVGDGINDAPLLARAPLSIAMMGATDLTKTQADLLLLTNNLSSIGHAVRVARRTQKIIRQNLAWALVYNAIALPVAAVGWVSPWQAAIGMSVSSLLVVGNAIRLRK